MGLMYLFFSFLLLQLADGKQIIRSKKPGSMVLELDAMGETKIVDADTGSQVDQSGSMVQVATDASGENEITEADAASAMGPYAQVNWNQDCQPSSGWLGAIGMPSCSDACRSRGYWYFLNAPDNNCKCCSTGFSVNNAGNFNIFSVVSSAPAVYWSQVNWNQDCQPSTGWIGTTLDNPTCASTCQVRGYSFFLKAPDNNCKCCSSGYSANSAGNYNVYAIVPTGTATFGSYYLANKGATSCPSGSMAASLDACQAASRTVLPNGVSQGRTLQVGSWGHVPTGCSVQSGGDWAAHFNSGKGNNDGGYSPVCSGSYYLTSNRGSASCPSGSTAVGQDVCQAASLRLLPPGASQGRTLQAGSWGHVPSGCSVQTGGDWAAHFNSGSGNNDGGYSPICVVSTTSTTTTTMTTTTIANNAASTCGMNTPGQCFTTSLDFTCFGTPGGPLFIPCTSSTGAQLTNNILTSFAATLPSPVGTFFNDLIGNMNSKNGGQVSIPVSYPLCWGDRTGNWLSSREPTQVATFLNRLWIPKNDDSWGTFGFHALNPCIGQAPPARFSMAFAVRTCTPLKVNFAFSFSPGGLICKPATPFQALIKPVAEFTFGISLDRLLGGNVQVVTGDGTSATVSTVFAPMHLFISGQINLKLEDFFPSLPKGFFSATLQGVLGISFDLAPTNLLSTIFNQGVDALPDYLTSLAQCATAPFSSIDTATLASKANGLSATAINMVTACVGGFTLTKRLTGGFMINLDILTKGLLPPLQVNLVQETIVTKLSAKKQGASGTDGLDRGFYIYRDALSGSASDVAFFVNRLLGRVSGLFDILGISVGSFTFPALGGGAGMYINDVGCGFLARVVINSQNMDLSCNFKFSNVKLTCKAPGVVGAIIEMLLDGVNWVINKVVDGIVTLYSKIPIDKIADTAISISNDIVNTGKCAYSSVTDATKCGVDTITDAAKCGADTITDGAKCGYDVVSKTITDAGRCGTDTIKNGAICGWNCIGNCITSWFQKCDSACSCSVPKSCQISVQTAKSCSIPKSCSVPKTCQISSC